EFALEIGISLPWEMDPIEAAGEYSLSAAYLEEIGDGIGDQVIYDEAVGSDTFTVAEADESRFSAELHYEGSGGFSAVEESYREERAGDDSPSFLGDTISHLGIDSDEDTDPRVGTADVPFLGLTDSQVRTGEYTLVVSDEDGYAEDIRAELDRIDLKVLRADDWMEIGGEDSTVIPTSLADEEPDEYGNHVGHADDVADDFDSVEWGDDVLYTGFENVPEFDEPGAYFIKAEGYDVENEQLFETDYKHADTLDEYTSVDAARNVVRMYDALMGGKPGTLDEHFVKAPRMTTAAPRGPASGSHLMILRWRSTRQRTQGAH
ncbi:MAG: hypothetical protein ABEI97_01175, partial [Candidatus Nanohaloarchaea archaeon]